jgi:cell wall-associated NlpC family hydrolase
MRLRFLSIILFSVAFLNNALSQSDSSSVCLADTQCIAKSPCLFDSDSLLREARKHLGKHYYYRGCSPKTGFDCSGFVMYNFKKWGLRLPHSSHAQSNYGTKIEPKEAQAGDLIFFKGSDARTKKVGHVGIVVANKGSNILFIHSSVKGGIKFDSTSADYYKHRFIKVKRLEKLD